jgi:tryptophan halogenase
MTQPIRQIVIAGGGSAGWMAAALLARALNPARVAITLVESDAISIVGVGEATIPLIHHFNALLGIDERDFIKATGATLKLGIEFVDWHTQGQRYFHPFGRYGDDFGFSPFHQHWLRAHLLGAPEPLADYSLTTQAAMAGKAVVPNAAMGKIFSTYSYAYHFDAALYGRYLRGLAEGAGVVRREGMITHVRRNGQSGHITALELDDGGVIAGDLFLDCTGFRSLLLGEAMGVGYQDWSHHLPCDRALAVPTGRLAEAPPFTRSTAHGAGWQWRIPLQHRTGNGLVYSSAHLGDEAAADLLLRHLDGPPQADPRSIRFTTGRREAFWQGNCIALGLASGFLEPLESTSIHLIQTGLTRLLAWFPHADCDPKLAARYNADMGQEFARIRDFLVLHYHATARDDTPFWRDCRAMAIPDTLAETIDLFRASGRIIHRPGDIFQDANWLAVLIGQGVMPRACDPLTDPIPPRELDAILRAMRKVMVDTVGAMPDHRSFLDSYAPSSLLADQGMVTA